MSVHNGYTLVVTVGRNIGREPMLQSRWMGLQGRIEFALSQRGTLIQRPSNKMVGQLGSWEGQQEDAACFVALIPSKAGLDFLRGRMVELARAYKQEAIGFIAVEGTNHLVRP